MKTKRIFSILLTIAMLTTFFIPMTVFAATITLKDGSAAPSNIYVGNSYTLNVTGVTVNFYTSNKTIATIGITDGKLEPKKTGKVTITAKDKKTGENVATKTFTVLQRATSVSCDNKLYLNGAGDTATLNVELTPSNSTDVITFASSNESVATVDSKTGLVTAVSNGTCSIYIYAKATAGTSNTSTSNKVTTCHVYVGAILERAEQLEPNKVEITFKSEIDAINPDDLEVKNSDGKEINVKSAVVSKSNSRKVELIFDEQISDGKDYTVSYNNSSCIFTATDGIVDLINIEPAEITLNVPTAVMVVEYDSAGVKLAQHKLSELPQNMTLNISFANDTDGCISGDDIIFYRDGAEATAKATYGAFSKTVILTAKAKVIRYDGFEYTIADSAPDFNSSSYKPYTTIALGDVGMGIYFKITDINGYELTEKEYGELTFSSTDSNVFTVSSKLDNGNGKKLGIEAKTVGDAYIEVKNVNNLVIATLPVNVGYARELSDFILDKDTIAVPNSGEGSAVTVNAKTTDQCGDLFDADITVEKADSQYPDIITSTKTGIGMVALTIDAAGITPGQYLYNISAGEKITKALTIIVGKPVTVTFDANGHGTAPEAIPNAVCDARIAAPAEPIAEGWLFAGWYKDAGLTQAWDFTKDVVTEDITLYARWRQDDASGTDHSGYMWWESTDTMPSESGNYYLANDVILSSDWTISYDTVLCLNDHVLNLNGHHIIIVYGSLTLQDCGTTIRRFTDNGGLWTLDQSQGTKTVTGGVITGGSATNGGAVLVNSNASFTMDGGNIVGNNSVDYGGGVRVDGGCFTMLDGTIAGNTSARGGGVHVSGTMNMSGGTIDGNTASAYGGGIYTGTATVSVTGGLISNNKAVENYGGGIGISKSAVATLENCTITGNTAQCGGGVYNYGKLAINEGTLIKNNSAATYGGGVYANTNSTLNMTDGEINENNSSSYGGGVYVNENSTLNMTGGEIIKNKGTSSGGGIYSKGAIELGGTAVIKDNTLTKNENNIRKYSGTLSISDETPPESGMEIGFHGEGTVATNAHPGDELFFFADDSAKGITYSDGNLITVDAVAAIGSRGYASVANAIAVAKMGDTVKLLADNSESFVLPVNVKFDINGNNYTGTVFAPDRYEVERNGNVYSVNCKGLIVDDEEEVFGESTLDSNEKSAILDELVNNDAIYDNNISEIEGVEKLETSLKSIEATKDEDGNIIVSKITYDVTPKDKDGNEIHEPLKPITFNLPLPEGFGEYADYAHGEDKGVVAVDKDTNSVELTLATFSQIELTPHKHSYTDGECECGEYDPINNKLHLIPDDEGGFEVLATGERAGTGVVIIAFYDNEGLNQLLDVKTFDLANGEMPTGKFIGNGYVKAMWWSDLGTMTPLCEAVEEPTAE